MTKRIAIVDDSPTFRESLRIVIKSINPEIELAEMENGAEFLEKAEKVDYNLVFMDIDMPVMNGISATKLAVHHHHYLPIIALTFHSDYQHTREMLCAGAKTYLVKDEMNFDAIEKVIEQYAY